MVPKSSRLLPYLFLLTALAMWAPSTKLAPIYQFDVDRSGPGVEFSADGRYLVARTDSTVQVREALTGRLLRVLERQQSLRGCRAAQEHLVTATWNATLRSLQLQAFSIASGHTVTMPFPTEARETLLDWTLSEDGRWLAAATTRQILLYDLPAGTTRSLERSDSSALAFVTLYQDRWLFAGSPSGWAVWATSSGQVRLKSNQPGWFAAFSPDGKWLAVGGQQATEFWDMDQGRVVGSWPQIARMITFSPDSRTVALSTGPSRRKDGQGWEDTARLTLMPVGSWNPVLTDHRCNGQPVRFTRDSSGLMTYRNAKEREEPPQLWVSVLSAQGAVLAHRYYPEGLSAQMGPEGHVAVGRFELEPYRTWTEILAPRLGAAVGRCGGGASDFHPTESVFWLTRGKTIEVWRIEGGQRLLF